MNYKKNGAALALANQVAEDVRRLGIGFVNAYAVRNSEDGWVLIDAGLPGASTYVLRTFKQQFDRPPEAIILTHGHVDHAGSARALAEKWDAQIYAHKAELPYLDGRSDYPPKDPTVGGAMGVFARLLTDEGFDLGDRVQTLPEDGSVPGLPDWQWVHTPGHTPGHISLFRESDRLLIAGDALTTTDLGSWAAQATWEREIGPPPLPFTPDWPAARHSIQRLADLSPKTIAAGHGLPVSGEETAAQLHDFARHFQPPHRGRYAERPAQTSGEGVVDVPPPPPDPLPRRFAMGALAALAIGIGIIGLLQKD